MPIDLNTGVQKYSVNTPNSAQIWAQRAAENAGKWEQNAKSPQAEQNYADGVQLAVQNQLRLKGLQGVTANDYAQGVQGATSNYAQRTSQAGNKWAAKFQPFAAIIDRTVASLPPRQAGNAAANVQNRVTPIAVALQSAKLGGAAIAGLGTTTAQPLRF